MGEKKVKLEGTGNKENKDNKAAGQEKKYFRVILNNREINNPVLNFLIAFATILLVIGIISFLISVVLPFLGTLLSVAFGIAGVMIVALIVAIFLLILASPLIALILWPIFYASRSDQKTDEQGNQLQLADSAAVAQ